MSQVQLGHGSDRIDMYALLRALIFGQARLLMYQVAIEDDREKQMQNEDAHEEQRTKTDAQR